MKVLLVNGSPHKNDSTNRGLEADGFIFNTPVYYVATRDSMTAFMDRLFYSEFCSNQNKAFSKKHAASVVVARHAGTTSTYDHLNKYFGLHEMPIISSRYWNLVYGASTEQLEKDTEGMYTMRVLGENMAYFLRCKEVTDKLGVKLPEREQPIFMNFIME